MTFRGRYTIRNVTNVSRLLVRFSFPSSDGTYAGFSVSAGGRRIGDPTALDRGCVMLSLPPGQQTRLDIGYRSRGMGTWIYRFGDGVQSANDFDLAMTTNFAAIDFPPHG